MGKLKIYGLPDKESASFLLLLLFVIVTYLNSFSGTFQFDDYNVIVNNGKVHTFAAWLSDLPHGIRPLLKLSWLLNWQAGFGLFGFHLVNLVIHLGNTTLVYLLAKLLHPDNEQNKYATVPIIAAAIFGLHPLQTEAVTYICGRSVSLMTLLYLGGIYFSLRWQVTTSAKFKWITLAIFMAAMAAKETAITFPLALLLVNVCKNGWTRSTLLKSTKTQWPSWLLMLLIPLILVLHPRYGALLEYSFDIRSWLDNILGQINAIFYLMSKIVLLNSMNIDPDLATTETTGVVFWGKSALLSLLLFTALLTLRKVTWLSLGLFWFFIHLLPTNSIVPRLDLVNDRQAYLTLAGLAIMLAQLLEKCSSLCRNTVVFILIMLLSGFTIARNRDYRSEVALWEDTAKKSPAKARVYNNLGYAYTLEKRGVDACKSYLQAIILNPDYDLAKANLARFCRDK